MADDNVLKSFLIGLGFKIDEQSERKWRDGIEQAGKAVETMATTAAAAFAGMQNVLSKFNDTWTDLFYVGQRSGAAIADINGIAGALKVLGNVSLDEVKANVISLGQVLHNPNMEAYLDQLTGVKKGASFEERMLGFSKLFHQLDAAGQQYRTDQLIQQAGLTPNFGNTLRYSSTDDLRKQFDANKAMSSSPEDQAKFARDAAEVTRKQAELNNRLAASSAAVIDWLDGIVLPIQGWLNQFASDHSNVAAGASIVGGSGIGGILKEGGELWLLKKFFPGLFSVGATAAASGAAGATGVGLLPALGVMASSLIAGAAALGVLLKGRDVINDNKPVNQFISWLDRLTGLGWLDEKYGIHVAQTPDAKPDPGTDGAPPTASKGGIWHMLNQLFGISSAEASELPPAEVDQAKAKQFAAVIQLRILQDWSNAIGSYLMPDSASGGPNAPAGHGGAAGNSGGSNFPGTDAGTGSIETSPRAKMIMSLFESVLGYDKVHASAATAAMWAESKGRPDAVGDGGSAYGALQWHADRQALFKQFIGHDIHGSSLVDQIRFADWELHHSENRRGGQRFLDARDPMSASKALVDTERPADRMGATLTRGHMSTALLDSASERRMAQADDHSVTMNQSNTVHISGSGDPKATGHEVREQLGRSTADMQRRLQGSVR